MHATIKRPMNSSAPTMPSKPSFSWRMTWTRLNGTQTRQQRKRAYCELRVFLVRCGYPFHADWPLRLLRRCDLWTLRSGDGVKAAVWLERVGHGRAALHLCAARDARGLWVRPRVLRSISDGARSAGYSVLTASPLPQHAPYLERLGFFREGAKYHLCLYEQTRHSQDY